MTAGIAGSTSLVRLQLEHERARAADRSATPHQLSLPFGDGWLDSGEQEIEFHGASVGLRIHVERDEPPCTLCAGFLDELVEFGIARPVESVSTGSDVHGSEMSSR